MARLEPLARKDVPELEEYFAPFEQRMGFLPNSLLTMARNPELVRAFSALGRVIYDPDSRLSLELRNCIAHVASYSAGCRYCMAHTANNAKHAGVAEDKIAAIWEYETSALFSEAERAALRFAQAAARVPNAVEDADVVAMKLYYSDDEIADILAVVAYFGFLNRWNDSLATRLEVPPRDFAEKTLSANQFAVGKHG